MESSLLLDQLVRTETHIIADEQLVRRQQANIDQLEREGHDTTYARTLLQHLQEMQAMRRADRDRMRAALGHSAPAD